jgi:magnesium chelatase subunit D
MKGYETMPLGQGRFVEADLPVAVGEVFKAKRLETPIDRLTRRLAGKRSYTRTRRKRGRYVQSRPAQGPLSDLALDATIRQAAPYQAERRRDGTAFAIEPRDWREKVRMRRAGNTILFVVDASWSMAAAERMKATKGAIMSLLYDAYQRRDQVGLVVFQKEQARLVLPLTGSVELAKSALKHVPVGGKTPLSSGLWLGYRVLMNALRHDSEAMPLMIVLTDGAGNVALTDRPATDEALALARFIRRSPIHSVVINMEHISFDRGLAQKLAEALGAPCYRLRELKASELAQTVRDQMG